MTLTRHVSAIGAGPESLMIGGKRDDGGGIRTLFPVRCVDVCISIRPRRSLHQVTQRKKKSVRVITVESAAASFLRKMEKHLAKMLIKHRKIL